MCKGGGPGLRLSKRMNGHIYNVTLLSYKWWFYGTVQMRRAYLGIKLLEKLKKNCTGSHEITKDGYSAASKLYAEILIENSTYWCQLQ